MKVCPTFFPPVFQSSVSGIYLCVGVNGKDFGLRGKEMLFFMLNNRCMSISIELFQFLSLLSLTQGCKISKVKAVPPWFMTAWYYYQAYTSCNYNALTRAVVFQ